MKLFRTIQTFAALAVMAMLASACEPVSIDTTPSGDTQLAKDLNAEIEATSKPLLNVSTTVRTTDDPPRTDLPTTKNSSDQPESQSPTSMLEIGPETSSAGKDSDGPTNPADGSTSPPERTKPDPNPGPCEFDNPNNPSDDPNPLYNGTNGRYPVSTSPIPAGFPTPKTTGFCGAGLTASDLKASSGMTVTEDGAVIDGLDINGSVKIEANNVTIKNSRITSTGHYALHLKSGAKDLKVESTRIISSGDAPSTAVYLQGYAHFDGVHITGGKDNMKATSGVLVENSYFAAVYRSPGSHNDVVQVRTGSNYTFRNNSMFGPWQMSTSVFLFQAKKGAGGGPISNVLVEDNYLSGGGYTVYATNPDFSFTNGAIRNNVIEQDSWQHGWLSNPAGATVEGNSFHSS